MDDLDRRLLAILRRDGRASFTAIAEQLDTSEGTIRARVRRLVDGGVIKRFTIRTEGGNVRALVEAQVAGVRASEPAAAIADWPEVEVVWEVTGDFDLVVVASLATPEHLNDIIDKMRALPGVESTRSRLLLREH